MIKVLIRIRDSSDPAAATAATAVFVAVVALDPPAHTSLLAAASMIAVAGVVALVGTLALRALMPAGPVGLLPRATITLALVAAVLLIASAVERAVR